MPYSLVSAATLGFDLVRLPGGRAVAEVLLTGLARRRRRPGAAWPRSTPPAGCRPSSGGVLAVRSRRARELAAGVPSVRAAAAGARPRRRARRPARAGHHRRRPHAGAAAARGRAGSRALRRRGAAHPGRAEAADVLADAAVGYWAAGVLPPLVRRELTAPFDRFADAGSVRDRAADLGPATARRRGLPGRAAPARRARPGRLAGRGRRGSCRAPAVGDRHARGRVGRARLRPHPCAGDGPAARRPGVPRRRLQRLRRAHGLLERRRGLRAGHRAWPTCSTRAPSAVLLAPARRVAGAA